MESGRKRYGCECDYYSLGVVLYELAEKAFPFGLAPAYDDFELEFRSPSLIGGGGSGGGSTGGNGAPTEVPHLRDLLDGLLTWDPCERLGGAGGRDKGRLQAHPFWENADWELVDARRLPSPLASHATSVCEPSPTKAQEAGPAPELASSMLMAFESSFSSGKQAPTGGEASQEELLKQYAASAALQRRIDDPSEETEAVDDRTLIRASELEVEGWEFVSMHALATEYVDDVTHTIRRASFDSIGNAGVGTIRGGFRAQAS